MEYFPFLNTLLIFSFQVGKKDSLRSLSVHGKSTGGLHKHTSLRKLKEKTPVTLNSSGNLKNYFRGICAAVSSK